MGRSGRSRRRPECLKAQKTVAANAADDIPPTFISVSCLSTSTRTERAAAANAADYIPPTFISIPSPTTGTNPAINTPRTPRPYGGAATSAPSVPSAPSAQVPQPGLSQSTTSLNSCPSNKSTTSLNSSASNYSVVSNVSTKSYVFSALRWGGPGPPSSPSLNYDFAPKCPNNLTGKNLAGANPFLPPRSNPAGRGLRRQTGSRHLSNASKGSLVSAASERHSETPSDIEQRERTAEVESLLKAQRQLLHERRNIYVDTVPEAQEAPFNPKAWGTEEVGGVNGYPKSAPPGPAPPLPQDRAQAWHKTHELPPETQKPAMPRDGEQTEKGQLAVEAFEELEKAWKKEVDIRLVREIVDYFEDKLEELTIMLCDDRGKSPEVNRMVSERIAKVDQTNKFHRQHLELKTVDEGRRDKLQDGVDFLAFAELEVDVEQLRSENAEMKEHYEILEGDHKIATESAGLDKELLEWHEEEEKNKDKRIRELEEKLEEKEKEIALAGFTSRPQLRKRPSGDLPGDDHSRTSSDSDNFDDSTSGNTSTMSNSSKISSVLSANANIHLLEMQYYHSRGRYSLASAAGAKSEKYLDASSDPKTAFAIKALRASTLALRNDSEDGDIEAARRLFEDAIFLAQRRKSEDSNEKRKEGEVWEDKCHAWLLHLADVQAKRRASAACSAFQSKGTSLEKKNCASQKKVPASARGEGGMQAMLDRAISMSAPHTPIHGPVLSTPTTPGWLSAELEAANFYRTAPSQRSRSPPEPRPPKPHLPMAFNQVASRQPPSSPPYPSSPPNMLGSDPASEGRERPTKRSGNLVADIGGWRGGSSNCPHSRSRSRSVDVGGMDVPCWLADELADLGMKPGWDHYYSEPSKYSRSLSRSSYRSIDVGSMERSKSRGMSIGEGITFDLDDLSPGVQIDLDLD